MDNINACNNSKLSDLLLFLIFFFSFYGFYASILLTSNFVGMEFSRVLTIPLRLFIICCMFFLFLKSLKKLSIPKINILFFFFVLAYLLRLFIDYNNGAYYYLSIPEVFVYLISFCVIPFYFISTITFTKRSFEIIFNSLLYSGLLFSVLVLFFYGKYIGSVARLGIGTTSEEVLNPLALSYSSIMIISIFFFYLLHNQLSTKKKLLMILTIALSIIPFFLGASRGSLVAILVTAFVYFFTSKNFKAVLYTSFFIVITVLALFILDDYFNSGLLDRVFETTQGIERGSAGAERLNIWDSALNQFINYPFIGDKLEVNNWNSYAHNILIETLQTTGIFGFLPLIILLFYIWKIVFFISKHHRKYFWVVILFIQSFVQSCFSGAIYNSSWLWMSMALVIGLYKMINLDKFAYK